MYEKKEKIAYFLPFTKVGLILYLDLNCEGDVDSFGAAIALVSLVSDVLKNSDNSRKRL